MTGNRNILRNIILIIQGILVSASFVIIHEVKTSSIISGVIFALYIMLYQKNNVELTRKEKTVKYILATIFSAFTVLGELLVIIDSEYTSHWMLTFLLCWLGQLFLMGLIVEYLLVVLRKNYFLSKKSMSPTAKECYKMFGFCMLLLVVVWGFGWLRTYPGSMSRDSIQIANMALGNIDLLAAVPIVYVYPVRILWRMGEAIFGSPNAGLALCTFVQVVVMAIIVSYLVVRLYANKVKKWICMLILAYFAFMPYNAYMLTTIWKDVPFSASILLFMVILCEYYWENEGNDKISKYSKLIVFVLSGMSICLMRNNGLFAYILFIPFGVYMFYKKNKKVVISLILILIMSRIVQGPVYDKVMTNHSQMRKEQKVEKIQNNPEKQESSNVKNATDSYNASAIYIITVQQLANVAVDRQDLSAEDYERLNAAINVEKIRENYAEKSDYCRRCIDITLPLVRYKLPEKEYLKTWAYFGLKYPINYLIGWRGQTWGYWYPDIQNWTTIDAIVENDIGIYKVPVLDRETTDKLVDLENNYKKIPGYGLLWSIGFVVWLNLFFSGVAYIRRGITASMLYILHIGVWLTLLVATPIYAEFRYMYSVFLCVPLSVLIPFIEKE